MVKYVYTLGAGGERVKVEELDRTVEYSYDELYRLTSETITKGKTKTTYTYAYDNVSNRTLKTVNGVETVYTYNALNQLVSENDTTYEYNLNGNLVRVIGVGKTAIYEYNADNKLVKATVQQGNNVVVESYTYDYAENRTSKTTTANKQVEKVYYLNDNSNLTNVLVEIGANGNEICYYTIGADLVSQEIDGEVYTYIYDGHGTVRALADEDGKITDTYTYDAFGNLISSTGSTANSYRYCGEQFDSTTGLYYLRARYMDTNTGRFISQDTYAGSTADPDTLHKYLYANSNPVMYVDPSGYMFSEVVAVGVSFIAENKYNACMVALGIALITELINLTATRESLILTSLNELYNIIEQYVSGVVDWCSINISIAADKITRVKDKDIVNEIEKIKQKYPNCTIIYRKGSGTYTNLTPREVDLEGLSYQLTMPIVMPYTFTAIELVNATTMLRASIDGLNHVSVYPTFMITMQQWIDSRKDAESNPHPYSVILQKISVRVG